MTKVLFNGKTFNQDELKRVNVILQTQANRLWAEVRTYSFAYQKGRKKYLEGYTSASEATSSWSNDASPVINTTLNLISQNEQQSTVQEAANAASAAREEERAESTAENDQTEEVRGSNDATTSEIQEGLPFSERDEENAQVGDSAKLGDLLAAEAERQQDAYAAEEAAKEAQQAVADAQNAADLAGGTSAGSATYTDANGVEHTVTNTGMGGVSYTGYEYNGQTGTLTTTGGGTTIFTPDDGGPQVTVQGVDVTGVVVSDGIALNDQNEQAQQEAQQAQQDAQNASQRVDEQIEAENQAAREQYENERDPDESGGYSESDSSTWSDPSYDPGEWGGF